VCSGSPAWLVPRGLGRNSALIMWARVEPGLATPSAVQLTPAQQPQTPTARIRDPAPASTPRPSHQSSSWGRTAGRCPSRCHGSPGTLPASQAPERSLASHRCTTRGLITPTASQRLRASPISRAWGWAVRIWGCTNLPRRHPSQVGEKITIRRGSAVGGGARGPGVGHRTWAFCRAWRSQASSGSPRRLCSPRYSRQPHTYSSFRSAPGSMSRPFTRMVGEPRNRSRWAAG
jgi:hypothetical protein